jgi:hypothetical protein
MLNHFDVFCLTFGCPFQFYLFVSLFSHQFLDDSVMVTSSKLNDKQVTLNSENHIQLGRFNPELTLVFNGIHEKKLIYLDLQKLCLIIVP